MIDKEKFNEIKNTDYKFKCIEATMDIMNPKFISCNDWQMMCEFLIEYARHQKGLVAESNAKCTELKFELKEVKNESNSNNSNNMSDVGDDKLD